MDLINRSLKRALEIQDEFPGFINIIHDSSINFGFRLVKRASARIYIGGDKYYCDFLKKLALAEIRKDINDRGVSLLVVDDKSMKMMTRVKIKGVSLIDRLYDLGVDIVNTDRVLSFYGEERSKRFNQFNEILDKIKFNRYDSGSFDITDVDKSAKYTFMAESFKYLVPRYIFENHDVSSVAIMDLDTKAPLVPQNVAESFISPSEHRITLSAYLGKPSLFDGIAFEKLLNTGVKDIIDPEGYEINNLNSVSFKREFSFYEFNNATAKKISDVILNDFTGEIFENKKWYFKVGEKWVGGYSLSEYSKQEEVDRRKVDSMWYKAHSEDVSATVRYAADNRAAMYNHLLGFQNVYVKGQELNVIVDRIRKFELTDKVFLCSDFLSHGDEIFPRDYCRKLSQKNGGDILLSFDSGGLYIIGNKIDLVKVFDGIIASPCSHWGVYFTHYRGNWKSDSNSKYESDFFCFKNKNITLDEGSNGSKKLVITKDAISINQPQLVDQNLLPEQCYYQYLFPFVGGAAYGAISLALDSCFEYGMAKKYPRSKMAYQLGRNILFGGPLLGTVQTAYNKFCDRLFSSNHNQSWSMSTAEFFLRNGLLFIPLTQGVTIPAMLSMAGATSSQYILKKVILRLGQVNTES